MGSQARSAAQLQAGVIAVVLRKRLPLPHVLGFFVIQERRSHATIQESRGDSNVAGYEYGSDLIWVQFKDGSVYRYTNSSAGSQNIERMKKLADVGQGLNSFINTNVRKLYEAKER